jgi:hypothetical protein
MTDHRQSPRKIVDRVLSLQIEPNINAIVLNISDEGLGFHALTPLTQTGAVRFSFLENGQRIEATGQLVWTDSTKKTGGLRFTSLSRATRERIWNLVDQADGASSRAASAEPAAPRSNDFRVPGSAPAQANPPYAPYDSRPETPLIQPTMPGFALLESDPQRTPYAWDQQMSLPGSRPKFLSGVVTGAILALILAAVVLFAYGNPAALLNQIRGRTSTPEPPAPLQAPAAAPASPASSENAAAASQEAPAASETPAATDDSKANSESTQQAPKVPSSTGNRVPAAPLKMPPKADTGDADLALADRYLRDKSGPASSVAAAHFLWSAVQKGNISAEIALAGLYVRGDGVAKSCTQARVLLRAAAEKGSSMASQELSQIVRTGCR